MEKDEKNHWNWRKKKKKRNPVTTSCANGSRYIITGNSCFSWVCMFHQISQDWLPGTQPGTWLAGFWGCPFKVPWDQHGSAFWRTAWPLQDLKSFCSLYLPVFILEQICKILWRKFLGINCAAFQAEQYLEKEKAHTSRLWRKQREKHQLP